MIDVCVRVLWLLEIECKDIYRCSWVPNLCFRPVVRTQRDNLSNKDDENGHKGQNWENIYVLPHWGLKENFLVQFYSHLFYPWINIK